jgi:hypothetical protein
VYEVSDFRDALNRLRLGWAQLSWGR